MRELVKHWILEQELIRPGDHVLAAVSGGADSVCMLLLLNELKDELDYTLSAIHVEHGIRGEASKKDEAYTSALCLKYEIPYQSISVDVPGYAGENRFGFEEAARILRYRALEQAAKETGANRVALAHQQEDLAETLLFHLARGSSLHGLASIPVKRGIYIRPMLNVGRKQIEAWLSAREISFCEDVTNQDLTYARNRIRHQVIPELKTINSAAVEHIARAAHDLALADDYIRGQAQEAAMQCVFRDGSGVRVEQEPFLTFHPLIRRELIHRVLSSVAGSSKDLQSDHISYLEGLLTGREHGRIDLPYGLEGYLRNGDLILKKKEALPAQSDPIRYRVNVPGSLQLPDGTILTAQVFPWRGDLKKIPQKRYTKWFDYDKISDNLCIRTRRPGDLFFFADPQVTGRLHRKKVQDYFVTEKIPPAKRDKTLLLADDSHVLWIVGYRISEAAKVTEQTKSVLEVRIIPPDAE